MPWRRLSLWRTALGATHSRLHSWFVTEATPSTHRQQHGRTDGSSQLTRQPYSSTSNRLRRRSRGSGACGSVMAPTDGILHAPALLLLLPPVVKLHATDRRVRLLAPLGRGRSARRQRSPRRDWIDSETDWPDECDGRLAARV